MAATTLVLTFTYENEDSFKLECNDAGVNKIIFEMEEDGNIGKLFDSGTRNAIVGFFERHLDAIITVMKG